jgi:hypothetical protein
MQFTDSPTARHLWTIAPEFPVKSVAPATPSQGDNRLAAAGLLLDCSALARWLRTARALGNIMGLRIGPQKQTASNSDRPMIVSVRVRQGCGFERIDQRRGLISSMTAL